VYVGDNERFAAGVASVVLIPLGDIVIGLLRGDVVYAQPVQVLLEEKILPAAAVAYDLCELCGGGVPYGLPGEDLLVAL